LLILFQQATNGDFAEQTLNIKEPVFRQIALEADNLLWLAEILADRNAADEFAVIWSSQRELAGLHSKLCHGEAICGNWERRDASFKGHKAASLGRLVAASHG
jgi:hypothetical protein